MVIISMENNLPAATTDHQKEKACPAQKMSTLTLLLFEISKMRPSSFSSLLGSKISAGCRFFRLVSSSPEPPKAGTLPV
jgi:hypothetical protein